MVHGVHVVMHARMRRCTGKNRNREIKLAWGNNRTGRNQMQEQNIDPYFSRQFQNKTKRATGEQGVGRQ